MKKMTYILILTSFTLLNASQNNINEDGTKFEAPRLAGDSLPIKAYQKEKTSSTPTTIMEAFEYSHIKGLLRYSAQHRDSALHTTQDNDDAGTPPPTSKIQQYSAIGGFLGIETAPFYCTSLGATFYTALPAGPNENVGLGGLKEVQNSNGQTEGESYAVLGEAFLKIEDANNRLVIGRQEMPDYRFVSLSNIRFSPFTHQGATYENTLVEDLQVNVALINSQKDRNAEVFEDMVRSARVQTGCALDPTTGKCSDTTQRQLTRGEIDTNNFDANGAYDGSNKSMFMLGATYKVAGVSLEAWDYYVDDFVNTLYLYTDYSFALNSSSNLTFAGQFASQTNVGDSVAGDVNTWFYGVKAQYAHNRGITLFTAFNQVAYNENSYDGGTIFVRWGTPQMFNSYQVQDSELAGTKSVGVGAQFELGKMKIVPHTVIRFRYAYYDMPDSLTQVDARQDRAEATFDLRYSFLKNDGFGIFTTMDGFSLQFRIAYDDYKTDYDFSEYKRVHGYDFESVTDSFIDTRLYLDYVF